MFKSEAVRGSLTHRPETPEVIAERAGLSLEDTLQTLRYQHWKKNISRTDGLYHLGEPDRDLSNDWLKRPLIQRAEI